MNHTNPIKRRVTKFKETIGPDSDKSTLIITAAAENEITGASATTPKRIARLEFATMIETDQGNKVLRKFPYELNKKMFSEIEAAIDALHDIAVRNPPLGANESEYETETPGGFILRLKVPPDRGAEHSYSVETPEGGKINLGSHHDTSDALEKLEFALTG